MRTQDNVIPRDNTRILCDPANMPAKSQTCPRVLPVRPKNGTSTKKERGRNLSLRLPYVAKLHIERVARWPHTHA